MEIYFNDLSLDDRTIIEYDEIQEIRNIYKELKMFGFNYCRIDDCSYRRLYSFIEILPDNANFKNFFFAFFQRPYENKEVIESEEVYYSKDWRFDGVECFGLALAFIMDSMSFSLYDSQWSLPHILIKSGSDSVSVRNISKIEHISYHLAWLEGLLEVDLVECNFNYDKKQIKLRDDHGKDVLVKFCNKIVNSPYVINVINSLPYNSSERKFIRKVKNDGLIEIVLPWTDKGLGIVVKTTGRNRRETMKIAEILEQEYGHM